MYFQTTRTKYEWSQVMAVISDIRQSVSNACKPVPNLQKVQLYSFTLQTSSSCVKVVVRCTVGGKYTLYCILHVCHNLGQI